MKLRARLLAVLVPLLAAWAFAVDVSVTGDPTLVSGQDCSDTDLPTYRFPTNATVNGDPVDILLTVLAEDNEWTTGDWSGACVRSQKDNDDNYTGRIEAYLRDRDDGDDVAWMDFKLELVKQGTTTVVTPARVQISFLDLDSWDTGNHDSDPNYTDTDDAYLETTGLTAAAYLSGASRVTISSDPGVGNYDVKFKGWYDNSGHQCEDSDAQCYASMVYLDTGTIYFRLQNDNAYGDPDADANAVRRMVISLKIDDLEAVFDYSDSGDAPTSYGSASLAATSKLALGGGLPPDKNESYLGTAQADGDDQAESPVIFDDEDGVLYRGSDLQGATFSPGDAQLEVHTYNESGQQGYLNVWADWNRDGDFDDSGERIVDNQLISQEGSAVTTVSMTVPDEIVEGDSYLRVIYSAQTITQPDASGGGEGEVEDYHIELVPGVPVSGYVFYDFSANGNRDAGEGWDLDYPQMYVKLIRGSGGSAEVVQVVPINRNTGAYRFDAVPPGEYRLIPDTNDDTSDTIPTQPSGWLFIGLAQRTITVAESPLVNQDFALFHGNVVLGNVFWDTGEGDGEANDVVRQGVEQGIPGVQVTATDGEHYRYTQTDEDGFFTMYIPYEWGDRHVYFSHPLRPATGYSTCACGYCGDESSQHPVVSWEDAMAVDSSGAWVDVGTATDPDTSLLFFGVARPSEFRPDQEGSTTTPGTRVYRHTYRPGTQGTVAFRRRSGDYVYQMRLDRNCDGDFEDDGETTWVPVTDTEGPSWVVDDAWPRNPDGSFKACAVEVRVLVPDGEPEGAVDAAEFTADLTWATNENNIVDRRTVVDTTRVRILGTLRLEKLGRRVADPDADSQPGSFPGDYAASVSGAPGDVLEYCIAYTNIGSDAVTNVVIHDPVPFFADALPNAFGAGKAIYWKDAGGSAHWLTADGGDDEGAIAAGILEVQAEATLGPGQGGLVCYRVRIR